VAKQQTYAALDQQGTQAAVYPAEDVLWAQGAPINDPGDQGIAYYGAMDAPPAPRSIADTQHTEDFLQEVVNGETSNGAYGERWVNVQQYGPTGYGPYNDQTNFQTGHSQNIVSNPASEQGWGVGPARRWAHYPIEESVNPFRNATTHLRNGQLPWVTADSSYYERTQLAWEQQWAPLKRRSPVAPVVQVPASVPFTQTVPTWGGGPVGHPGIDYPAGPVGDSGIYG
jgi:hypothetical protein